MQKSKIAFSNKLTQAMIEEIEQMKKGFEEKQGMLTDEYISVYHTIKAKSALVKKEQADMEVLLKEFEQKHKASGRPVFTKSLNFYLDCLKTFEFKKLLVALEDEISSLKKEMEESAKTEVDMIKNLQEIINSPAQHLK